MSIYCEQPQIYFYPACSSPMYLHPHEFIMYLSTHSARKLQLFMIMNLLNILNFPLVCLALKNYILTQK